MKSNTVEKSCERCGGHFVAEGSNRLKRKYCSKLCSGNASREAKRSPGEYACETCGTVRWFKDRPSGVFCKSCVGVIGREVNGRKNLDNVRERILAGVKVAEGDCWVWQRGRYTNGYGQIRVGGKTRQTHRVAYEIWKGPIPTGLVLDHLCVNRPCCNPEHLEAVTYAVNNQRAVDSHRRQRYDKK